MLALIPKPPGNSSKVHLKNDAGTHRRISTKVQIVDPLSKQVAWLLPRVAARILLWPVFRNLWEASLGPVGLPWATPGHIPLLDGLTSDLTLNVKHWKATFRYLVNERHQQHLQKIKLGFNINSTYTWSEQISFTLFVSKPPQVV